MRDEGAETLLVNRFTSRHRRRLLGATVALLLVASTAAASGLPGVPGLSTGSAGSGVTVRGIATFGAVPSADQVTSLRALGLRVQPMEHLPLAIVEGPAATLQQAVASGTAADVYPDRPIELLDQESSDAMGAAVTRTAGLTGKGVTVAVVDSGCDASHPDLADHVAHNVKLYSGEYVNQRDGDALVVPVEQGPYQNSDVGSGHGTHVAGIIAADGTTDESHIGVAPDAELVCYSIGETLFTTAVVTAYDHMLDQENLWSIDVVNNSWGNSFRHFDPKDPVAVATKAVADKGVAVVFAAGNSGYENAEMSLNPFSQAPWVISVAATTVEHQRADFSSNGLVYDNSTPVAIPEDGHTSFRGERIGIYHPDVAAPGDDISSTCDTAGTVVGPCPPGENTTASGTSMAAPHVAGAVAVLRQANPELTPTQLRWVLQATAEPVTVSEDSDAKDPLPKAPFWQVGYGRVDLPAAVKLARSADFAGDLEDLHSARDTEILRSNPYALSRTDYWTYAADRFTLGGSDAQTFKTTVGAGVSALKVTLSHPSLAVLGENGMSYTVTVKDAAGKVVGTTTEASTGAGTASVLLPLGSAKRGTFVFEVAGDYGVSDPDTIDSASLAGETITLQVAQLRKR